MIIHMAAAAASEAILFNRSAFITPSFILRPRSLSPNLSAKKLACCACSFSNERSPLSLISVQISSRANDDDIDSNTPASNSRAIDFDEILLRRGLAAAAIAAVVVLGCRRALAAEGYGVWERSLSSIRGSWPKVLQVLVVFKEQGLILAALLGLSAFFSMAETSITTLWPWKVMRFFNWIFLIRIEMYLSYGNEPMSWKLLPPSKKKIVFSVDNTSINEKLVK